MKNLALKERKSQRLQGKESSKHNTNFARQKAWKIHKVNFTGFWKKKEIRSSEKKEILIK